MATRRILSTLPRFTSSFSRPTARIQWHDIYRSAQRNSFSNAAANSTRPKPSNTHWQYAWQYGQKRSYGRRPLFNQGQFQTASILFKRWAAQPTFYYQVAAISGGVAVVYIYNLETVAVSGRKRFNVISPEREKQMGQEEYQKVMQQFGNQLMASGSKEHRMVERVLQRLLPHSGLDGENWTVQVIDDPMKNAFVIPGGKVFVFRGILDVCQGEDGLAAVLGHEIAHNVAHHAAERASQSWWLMVLPLVGMFFGIDPGALGSLSQLAFQLPGSRAQELEADYIGLLMMAEACYEPQAAMGLWARMEEEEKKAGGGGGGAGQQLQFMSTHPSNHNRLEKIREWLPKAEDKRVDGGCENVRGYVGGFSQAADLEKFGMSTTWK